MRNNSFSLTEGASKGVSRNGTGGGRASRSRLFIRVARLEPKICVKWSVCLPFCPISLAFLPRDFLPGTYKLISIYKLQTILSTSDMLGRLATNRSRRLM